MIFSSQRYDTESIIAETRVFMKISMLCKNSLKFFFAKIPHIKSPKKATGVKLQRIKRSIPLFVYRTDSAFLARSIVMNRIKTAAILTIRKQFLISAVEVKLFFHKKLPAAKIIIAQKRYMIVVPYSGASSDIKK